MVINFWRILTVVELTFDTYRMIHSRQQYHVIFDVEVQSPFLATLARKPSVSLSHLSLSILLFLSQKENFVSDRQKFRSAYLEPTRRYGDKN